MRSRRASDSLRRHIIYLCNDYLFTPSIRLINLAMSHYMTDKLEFIGLLGFKLMFEEDGNFAQILFLFLCSFPHRRKGTKGATKGKGRLRFHPFPLESNPHRFVYANIAIKPPCAIRLPHASVGLAFQTVFSANIAYFSGFFALNTPKMRSVGEHFCRNVCTALRFIP